MLRILFAIYSHYRSIQCYVSQSEVLFPNIKVSQWPGVGLVWLGNLWAAKKAVFHLLLHLSANLFSAKKPNHAWLSRLMKDCDKTLKVSFFCICMLYQDYFCRDIWLQSTAEPIASNFAERPNWRRWPFQTLTLYISVEIIWYSFIHGMVYI